MDTTKWTEALQRWVRDQEERGVSKPEIARSLKVSRPHFLNVLSGRDGCSQALADRIEALTGIPASWRLQEAPDAAA